MNYAELFPSGTTTSTARPGVQPTRARTFRIIAGSPYWVKQAEIDGGTRPGVTSTEHDELVELRKEVRELRRSNDILQAAASFFGAELDRRRTK